GPTREAVDVRFIKAGKTFVAIDTAGVRKRSSRKGDIEFYSLNRAERSIRRADVVLLMIDATEPISIVDKQLGHYIAEQFKPVILVINKFDLVSDRATSGDYADYLEQVLPGLDYAPVAVTTATEQRNVQGVLDLAANLFKQASTRVTTGQLNDFIEKISGERGPGGTGGTHGGPAKIYYATQVGIRPPTIVLFVNSLRKASGAFERFVINRLREMLPFKEVPLRLMVRERSRRAIGKEQGDTTPRSHHKRKHPFQDKRNPER
ncbi:MAG: 50S ribosome-binding GTPase, partial [Phycisphaerae bacterium]|nr:50S ribosome-binding GTPase [Phycisphaerae bacterium]